MDTVPNRARGDCRRTLVKVIAALPVEEKPGDARQCASEAAKCVLTQPRGVARVRFERTLVIVGAHTAAQDKTDVAPRGAGERADRVAAERAVRRAVVRLLRALVDVGTHTAVSREGVARHARCRAHK